MKNVKKQRNHRNMLDSWVLIKGKNRFILGILLGFFILAGTLLVLKLWYVNSIPNTKPTIQDHRLIDTNIPTSQTQVENQANLNTIYHNGTHYRINPDHTNILVLGIDRWGKVIEQDIAGRAGRADVVLLLTLDQSDESISILSISRDSMVQVAMIDVFGIVYGYVLAQLGYQFAYGDGAFSSLFAMRRTVSQLLYELPIHGTVAFNVCAIRQINEAVGGVEITFPRDFLYIDDTFTKGNTVILTDQQAERFVQFRDIYEEFSNVGRMERQELYLRALFDHMRELTNGSRRAYLTLYEKLEPYMTTDIRAEDLSTMTRFQWSEHMSVLPGQLIAGEIYDEFHVEQEALKELVLELFYIPVT